MISRKTAQLTLTFKEVKIPSVYTYFRVLSIFITKHISTSTLYALDLLLGLDYLCLLILVVTIHFFKKYLHSYANVTD